MSTAEVNEWLSEPMREWIQGWINQWIDEWINDTTNESPNELAKYGNVMGLYKFIMVVGDKEWMYFNIF